MYYSEQYRAPAACSNKLFKLNRTREANHRCSPWSPEMVFVCDFYGLERKPWFSLNLWRNIFCPSWCKFVNAECSLLNAVLPVFLSNSPCSLRFLPEHSALLLYFKIVTHLPHPSPFWRPASIFIVFDTTPGFNSLIPSVALKLCKCTQCPPSSPTSCLWFYN